MNIGELSRRTGVSIRSLRYYETKHLLSPQRRENGYRFYDESAVERVKAIQFYLKLGLTTTEIAAALGDCDLDMSSFSPESNYLYECPEELALYRKRLAEVEEQIEALERVRMYLKRSLSKAQETVSI
ncbi:DNA-binding transcriptional MerR regulator [Thermosporothrix hazakensis]|jgi:DNA-binding transcriptional MerR regulator|uniref:DNA-binding transcriptional MerR regulator n=1 Tax=Thermosporothrix hazakensis TaxID=644383 RepID=A0A326U7Z4_THEHA|nr:MerR family transcriptional regulator [Thermosporothrix hazakensis]PZW31234.1 DNA-binding transcriptional MerR regulator [Thermosporothrix hazakensis]GCE50857.1 transcriptional regulator [Thermosporothrix hazakensis]